MDKFILHSPFKTVDEQNRSVDALVKGVETGAQAQVLFLGVDRKWQDIHSCQHDRPHQPSDARHLA